MQIGKKKLLNYCLKSVFILLMSHQIYEFTIHLLHYQNGKSKKEKSEDRNSSWRSGLTFIIVFILKAYSMPFNHVFSF